MSYLERWWRDASEDKRETFTKLVKNGQLEIVGGGWVMNDEVCLQAYVILEIHALYFSVAISYITRTALSVLDMDVSLMNMFNIYPIPLV